jgi:hypothetical protein
MRKNYRVLKASSRRGREHTQYRVESFTMYGTTFTFIVRPRHGSYKFRLSDPTAKV